MGKISKIKSKIAINKRKFFLGSFSTFLLLVSLYLFSVQSTILNTSQRSQIEEQADILRYNIGELEFELLAKRNDINLEVAYSIGFLEAKNVKFLSKKSATVAVSPQNF